MPLTLRLHKEALSLCQLPPGTPAPVDILAQPMTAFFRTYDETTLLCPTVLAPKNVKSDAGFIALQLVGPFAFGETGILTQIVNPLATAKVSIVPFATFDTDYILIKADQRQTATDALKKAGHTVIEAGAP